VHEYPDAEWVFPGETTRAYLAFLSPDEHLGKIHPGMYFQVREGTRVIAEGTVTRLVDLESSARKNLEPRGTE